jgi:hypothetical protein
MIVVLKKYTPNLFSERIKHKMSAHGAMLKKYTNVEKNNIRNPITCKYHDINIL